MNDAATQPCGLPSKLQRKVAPGSLDCSNGERRVRNQKVFGFGSRHLVLVSGAVVSAANCLRSGHPGCET
jgi:hypothetical protein